MAQSDQIAVDNLMPLDVAATRLGVPLWTLRWWIQRGRVESHKIEGRRLMSESEIRRLQTESRKPRMPARPEYAKKGAQNQVENFEVAA